MGYKVYVKDGQSNRFALWTGKEYESREEALKERMEGQLKYKESSKKKYMKPIVTNANWEIRKVNSREKQLQNQIKGLPSFKDLMKY